MENLRGMMKMVLVDSLETCTWKCINNSNFNKDTSDQVNTYEKKCLSTCSDKYVEIYLEKLGELRNAVFKEEHKVEAHKDFWPTTTKFIHQE